MHLGLTFGITWRLFFLPSRNKYCECEILPETDQSHPNPLLGTHTPHGCCGGEMPEYHLGGQTLVLGMYFPVT